MPPIPEILVRDIVDGARLRKDAGVIVEVSRVALLSGLPPSINDSVLGAAIAALPDDWQSGAEHPEYAGLLVRNHQVSMVQPRLGRVEVTYRRPGSGSLEPPPNFPLRVRGGGSSEQIETMVDRFGVTISVEHNGDVQGGVIHPGVSVEQLSLAEIMQSSDPTALQRVWNNTVNTGPFFFDCGAEPREWKIQSIFFELEDAETLPFPTWSFSYELVKKPIIIAGVAGSHDPQIYYRDRETGEPPEGLVEGVGYKTIQWHFPMDFSQLFGGCG